MSISVRKGVEKSAEPRIAPSQWCVPGGAAEAGRSSRLRLYAVCVRSLGGRASPGAARSTRIAAEGGLVVATTRPAAYLESADPATAERARQNRRPTSASDGPLPSRWPRASARRSDADGVVGEPSLRWAYLRPTSLRFIWDGHSRVVITHAEAELTKLGDGPAFSATMAGSLPSSRNRRSEISGGAWHCRISPSSERSLGCRTSATRHLDMIASGSSSGLRSVCRDWRREGEP